MNQPLEWTTVQRKVNDLVPLDINPRKISEAKRMKMIESLQRFNLVDIPVVDFDNTILSGHQRMRAMQAIGRGEEMVDVRYPNRPLTEKERKDYVPLANTHFGEFDLELFEEHFGDVDLDDLGIERGDLFREGFDEDEPPVKLEAKEDDYEPPAEIVTDIVPGDLFEIGQHRLLCGDSTSADDVERVMGGEKADMVFTDPPYAVNYGADQIELMKKSGGKFSKSRAHSQIIGDNLPTEECAEKIWRPAFKNLYESAKDECSFYMTMCQGGDQMMMMMMSEKWKIKHELIWVKNAAVFSMGRLDYDYQHEPILFGWKKKHRFHGNGEFLKSVWHIDRPLKSDLHPTTKPVRLVSNAVLNSSLEDEIIIDFFLGSGTTMVATHQLNRRCYGIEIGPKYCQVIVDRMLRLDPTLEVKRNGQPYTPKK